MHRKELLKSLEEYNPLLPGEEVIRHRFKEFVQSTPDCFERTHEAGHVTGSAFVLSSDRTCILLAFHTKLQKWLQLGGHADGCPRVHEVALREAMEESGMTQILPYLTPLAPIDFDIHEIPHNKKENSHYHYDVRFVFQSQQHDFICSNESLALKWVPIDDVPDYSKEPSVLRVIDKIKTTLWSNTLAESCKENAGALY